MPERRAVDALKRAFALGVNLVNTGPDYEGADDLILLALRECDQRHRIYLSFQAGGNVEEFERVFEATCEKFDTECLDLFGISSISDHEAYGLNVWKAGGLVEFLQKKKDEGRIRAIFASDHGSPDQTMALLKRDVFDALMLAYNPLGFHLVTFRAKTVWQFEAPPIPIDHYEREDLRRTGQDIIPLAKQRDVGIMLMKPLAGGLLCPAKAFPSHPWRENFPQQPSAIHVLRYLLTDEAVTCVVPGMASIEEVEENTQAGMGDIHLTEIQVSQLKLRANEMTQVLCSRCGQCDDLCSQKLPISFVFRAAYHYIYPSAPFGISSTLQYFRLHPWERCICETCISRACHCEAGIDIPGELIAIHSKMLELRERGLVPAVDKGVEDWATGRPYSVKILSREIPTSLHVGEKATVRLHLRNTGTLTWYRKTNEEHACVCLAVYLGGHRIQVVHLRQDIAPGGNGHFVYEFEVPIKPGAYHLRMEFFEEGGGSLSEQDVPAIRETIWAIDHSSMDDVQRNSLAYALEKEKQQVASLQEEIKAVEALYERRLDEFRRQSRSKQDVDIQIKEEVRIASQKNKELIQYVKDLNHDLISLSTSKAAFRQIMRNVLENIGLLDFLYSHQKIIVPLYNFFFHDTWTPGTFKTLRGKGIDSLANQPSSPDLIAPDQTNIAHHRGDKFSSMPDDHRQHIEIAVQALEKKALPSSENSLAVKYMEHNVPPECMAGTRCVFRVRLQNTGSESWYRDPSDGHYVGLCLFIDNEFVASGKQHGDIVKPGEKVAISIMTDLPQACGRHVLRFDLMMHNRAWFSQTGSPSLGVPINITAGEKSRTEELLELAHQRNYWFFSPGQTVHRSEGHCTYPVFVESSKGCRVTDVDGKEFVDLLMGWGCCLLGYAQERIQKAIMRSVKTSAGLTSLPHRLEIEVSETLCQQISGADEVLFGKNGSDVTTWAVRAARVHTGRKTILFSGYHGWQDWYVGGQGFSVTGVPPGNNPYNISLPYLNMQSLEAAVVTYAGDIAAIMIEPAASCINVKDPYHEMDGPYLKRAEELARQQGALFILDEIMTGFRYRCGTAQAAYGLTPDMTCLGKAIANGMPLSALTAKKGVLKNTISQIYYAPTMKGEAYSYAAAFEALRIYAEEDIPVRIWDIGDKIRSRVNEICRQLDLNAALIGPPYRMFFKYFDFSDEQDIFCRTLLQQELIRHGIISYKGYIMPCLSHDEDAINICVDGFASALGKVREAISSRLSVKYLDIPDVLLENRVLSQVAQAPQTSSQSNRSDSTFVHPPACKPNILDKMLDPDKLKIEIQEHRVILESPPATVNIELTDRCNVKPACVFCAGKNQTGYQEVGDISTAQLYRYWPYLLRSQRVNDCSYGEPLLYPNIEEVISRLSSAGVTFGFSTNGLLLDERWAHFLIEKADKVQFVISLNAGTHETYNRLHGQNFETVIENIERYIHLHNKARPNQPLPFLLSYIVMKTNRDEIFDFLELSTKLGVKQVMFRHLFDLHASGYTSNRFDHLFDYEQERLSWADYQMLEAQIRDADKFQSLEIEYAWNAQDAFIAQQAEDGVTIPCLFPWKFLCIQPLHDIYTPCTFLKQGIALPSQASLEEVWNGGDLVTIRKSLCSGTIPDFCQRFGDSCPLVLSQRAQRG